MKRVQLRAAWSAALLFGLWGGCRADPGGTGSFVSHCSEVAGDATCAANYDNRPYCSTCVVAENNQGCVTSRPAPACRTNGGPQPGTSDTGMESSESGDEDTGSTGTTGLDTTDGTTGAVPCAGAEGSIDAECERVDPGQPYCVQGQCSSCVDAGDHDFCSEHDESKPACDEVTGLCVSCTEVDDVCGGSTPVCDADGACAPCRAHAECPDTACHLDPKDPLVGACFGGDEVIWVDSANICPGMGTQASPACSLAQAVNGVVAGHSAVVRLAGGGSTYPEQVLVDDDVTIAIVGTGTPPLVSGDPDVTGASVVVDDAILYLERVRISNNVSRHGLSCGDGIVVLDDSEVRGNARYGLYTTAPCDLTVRRSTVFSNGHGGVRQFGGTLHLVNSAVGINGNGSTGPGINAQYAELEVLYSTIAGNQATGNDTLWCLQATGWVRNSILVGAQAGSIQLACFSLTFGHNAVDTPSFAGGTNSNVGAYAASWFAGPNNGNFQLTAAGQTVFAGIAQWMDGDPTTDADGTPRPMGMPGFPGYDEP